jgi:WD40 repeat protein
MGWAARALAFVLAVASVASAKDLYEPVGPFGPKEDAFPWHCAFSPDGKWVAFIDGHTSYFTIWDFEKRKEVWAGPPPKNAYRLGWSRDSKRVATITGDTFVVVQGGAGGWKVAHTVSLGFKTTISARTSPNPLNLRHDAMHAMFAEDKLIYGVSAEKKQTDEVTTKGEIAYHVLKLPQGATAFAKLKPFGTEVLHGGGHIKIKAIVLAGTADGALWLVAKSAKRLDRGGRADLEVVEGDSGDKVARFKATGKHPRPLVQACFSPDGKLLATVEGSGVIALRNPKTAKLMQKIKEYAVQRYAMGIAFSPDGKWLITGGRRKGKEGFEHGTLLWKRTGEG